MICMGMQVIRADGGIVKCKTLAVLDVEIQ